MRKIYAKAILAVMSLLTATAMQAQIPEGYYASLKGKKGAALKNAVHELIKDAKVLSYGSGKGHTWEGFYYTDRRDDNTCIDRYCNDALPFSSPGSVVSGKNIEHSFPKSWWGGSQTQAYKDLYNLMPSESKINSSKSNYPMGKVTNVKTDNGCTKVGTGSNGYQLWEPADKWKGDFARGYMYMATAYQDYSWSGTQANQILTKGDYPTLQKWAYTLYIEWAKTDRVDAIEVKRNNEVYKIQGNRNPYVDFPNLMEYVWGDSVNYAFDPAKTLTSADYVNGGGGDEPEPDPESDIIWKCDFTKSDGDCTIDDVSLSGVSSVWTRDSKYGWKGTAFSSGASHAAESVLLTPEIDLDRYKDITLSFNHAVNFCASPSTTLAVELICEGQGSRLASVKWPAGTDWDYVSSGTIDLSAYTGCVIQIGFRYRSTASEAGTWEIKDITLAGKVIPSGIEGATVGKAHLDLSQPYEAFTVDGRRVDAATHRGLMIVRQNGMTWKVVR